MTYTLIQIDRRGESFVRQPEAEEEAARIAFDATPVSGRIVEVQLWRGSPTTDQDAVLIESKKA
jgi:hypothetical protein